MAPVKIIPIILCGGAGSRLWPMSRRDKPKQFHALFNERTLLENAVDRFRGPKGDGLAFDAPFILGSASLKSQFNFIYGSQNDALSGLVLEPCMRDTAAAIAAITAKYSETTPEALLLVVPSDARIDDVAGFHGAIEKAAKTAISTDAIMLIGIEPTRPETQYGYIEVGQALEQGYSVRSFREKPDRETADKYLKNGNTLWNAGMFLFRAGRMAEDFAQLQPDIWQAAKSAVKNAQRDGDALLLDDVSFAAAPKLSIDYAIMEKVENVGVIPACFDWDDLGSWNQIYAGAAKDDNGNVAPESAILVAAKNNLVRSDGSDVAIAGINGLTVVAEDNKVLVVPTEHSHLVKDIFEIQKNRADANLDPQNKDAWKTWLLDTAFPFWAENGLDHKHGGVHEALNFDASPAKLPAKRLRVIARQIYCYAQASLMGWKANADDVLRHCFDTLIKTGWHKDGGFIHLFNPDGSVQDDERDTYDQCFVLFALAWLHRAKKWPEARQWADKTIHFLDTQLKDRARGGFFENLQRTEPRRSNPQMHYFEAMLAWYDATGEHEFLQRASEIVALFEKHFFDAETGTLTERFEGDWSVMKDADADVRVEPGHHYEWAWLLMRYNALNETPGLENKARMLFATAKGLGHHKATGAAADTMMPDGSALSESARCWPQTEALKAAIIFEKRGVASAESLKKQMLEILRRHYIDGPIKGGWYDAIDANGHVAAPNMPSSTFYHIVCALVEYIES